MKKIITLLFVASLLLACNANSDKEKTEADKPATEAHHEHDASAGLELNNGAKWRADSSTLLNVAALQEIVTQAKKESITDYHQTAKHVEDGLNKMVKECKMKGPDHDALHKWLEPLIEKNKTLKASASAEAAAEILNDMGKHIRMFEQYFE